MAENKKQVDFEINSRKKRLRAGAGKSLESATECGKVDVRRAARKEVARWCVFTSFVSPKGQGAKNGNVTTKNTKLSID